MIITRNKEIGTRKKGMLPQFKLRSSFILYPLSSILEPFTPHVLRSLGRHFYARYG